MTPASVLVVEDNDLEREILTETLRQEGFSVEMVATGAGAMDQLAMKRFDVLVAGLPLPGFSAEQLLAKVHTTYPSCQVVILTTATKESATKAIENGAFYCMTKF